MNKATITKLEKQAGDDFFTVTFDRDPSDMDLDQLGGPDGDDFEKPVLISGVSEWTKGEFSIMACGVKLLVGDSITDEMGGDPIIASQHGVTEEKNMEIVKDHDYRDVFQAKQEGRS